MKLLFLFLAFIGALAPVLAIPPQHQNSQNALLVNLAGGSVVASAFACGIFSHPSTWFSSSSAPVFDVDPIAYLGNPPAAEFEQWISSRSAPVSLTHRIVWPASPTDFTPAPAAQEPIQPVEEPYYETPSTICNGHLWFLWQIILNSGLFVKDDTWNLKTAIGALMPGYTAWLTNLATSLALVLALFTITRRFIRRGLFFRAVDSHLRVAKDFLWYHLRNVWTTSIFYAPIYSVYAWKGLVTVLFGTCSAMKDFIHGSVEEIHHTLTRAIDLAFLTASRSIDLWHLMRGNTLTPAQQQQAHDLVKGRQLQIMSDLHGQGAPDSLIGHNNYLSRDRRGWLIPAVDEVTAEIAQNFSDDLQKYVYDHAAKVFDQTFLPLFKAAVAGNTDEACDKMKELQKKLYDQGLADCKKYIHDRVQAESLGANRMAVLKEAEPSIKMTAHNAVTKQMMMWSDEKVRGLCDEVGRRMTTDITKLIKDSRDSIAALQSNVEGLSKELGSTRQDIETIVKAQDNMEPRLLTVETSKDEAHTLLLQENAELRDAQKNQAATIDSLKKELNKYESQRAEQHKAMASWHEFFDRQQRDMQKLKAEMATLRAERSALQTSPPPAPAATPAEPIAPVPPVVTAPQKKKGKSKSKTKKPTQKANPEKDSSVAPTLTTVAEEAARIAHPSDVSGDYSEPTATEDASVDQSATLTQEAAKAAPSMQSPDDTPQPIGPSEQKPRYEILNGDRDAQEGKDVAHSTQSAGQVQAVVPSSPETKPMDPLSAEKDDVEPPSQSAKEPVTNKPSSEPEPEPATGASDSSEGSQTHDATVPANSVQPQQNSAVLASPSPQSAAQALPPAAAQGQEEPKPEVNAPSSNTSDNKPLPLFGSLPAFAPSNESNPFLKPEFKPFEAPKYGEVFKFGVPASSRKGLSKSSTSADPTKEMKETTPETSDIFGGLKQPVEKPAEKPDEMLVDVPGELKPAPSKYSAPAKLNPVDPSGNQMEIDTDPPVAKPPLGNATVLDPGYSKIPAIAKQAPYKPAPRPVRKARVPPSSKPQAAKPYGSKPLSSPSENLFGSFQTSGNASTTFSFGSTQAPKSIFFGSTQPSGNASATFSFGSTQAPTSNFFGTNATPHQHSSGGFVPSQMKSNETAQPAVNSGLPGPGLLGNTFAQNNTVVQPTAQYGLSCLNGSQDPPAQTTPQPVDTDMIDTTAHQPSDQPGTVGKPNLPGLGLVNFVDPSLAPHTSSIPEDDVAQNYLPPAGPFNESTVQPPAALPTRRPINLVTMPPGINVDVYQQFRDRYPTATDDLIYSLLCTFSASEPIERQVPDPYSGLRACVKSFNNQFSQRYQPLAQQMIIDHATADAPDAPFHVTEVNEPFMSMWMLQKIFQYALSKYLTDVDIRLAVKTEDLLFWADETTFGSDDEHLWIGMEHGQDGVVWKGLHRNPTEPSTDINEDSSFLSDTVGPLVHRSSSPTNEQPQRDSPLSPVYSASVASDDVSTASSSAQYIDPKVLSLNVQNHSEGINQEGSADPAYNPDFSESGDGSRFEPLGSGYEHHINGDEQMGDLPFDSDSDDSLFGSTNGFEHLQIPRTQTPPLQKDETTTDVRPAPDFDDTEFIDWEVSPEVVMSEGNNTQQSALQPVLRPSTNGSVPSQSMQTSFGNVPQLIQREQPVAPSNDPRPASEGSEPSPEEIADALFNDGGESGPHMEALMAKFPRKIDRVILKPKGRFQPRPLVEETPARETKVEATDEEVQDFMEALASDPEDNETPDQPGAMDNSPNVNDSAMEDDSINTNSAQPATPASNGQPTAPFSAFASLMGDLSISESAPKSPASTPTRRIPAKDEVPDCDPDHYVPPPGKREPTDWEKRNLEPTQLSKIRRTTGYIAPQIDAPRSIPHKQGLIASSIMPKYEEILGTSKGDPAHKRQIENQSISTLSTKKLRGDADVQSPEPHQHQAPKRGLGDGRASADNIQAAARIADNEVLSRRRIAPITRLRPSVKVKAMGLTEEFEREKESERALHKKQQKERQAELMREQNRAKEREVRARRGL